MEDIILKWLDFICPYILLVLMLTIGLTVCALFAATVGAVVTAFTRGGRKRIRYRSRLGHRSLKREK